MINEITEKLQADIPEEWFCDYTNFNGLMGIVKSHPPYHQGSSAFCHLVSGQRQPAQPLASLQPSRQEVISHRFLLASKKKPFPCIWQY